MGHKNREVWSEAKISLLSNNYEFDAELDAYGALFDPVEQNLRNNDESQEDPLFERGLQQYNQGNMSGALMTWSEVIAINPHNANAYYSRAIVKNELYARKDALRDYVAALEIAPTFVSALLNRGSVRDDNGYYVGAIEDYDMVLSLSDCDDVT